MNDDANTLKIRLLLADVDGTLVTKDKVLTDRTIASVKKMQDAGVDFAITSGRPPKGMAMLIEPLNLKTPIAAFNGGMFCNPDLTVIDAHTLPADVSKDVIEKLRSHGLDVWIYKGTDWYIQDKDGAHVAREQWTVKFEPKVVANYDDLLDDIVKIVGVSDDAPTVAAAESDTQKEFGDKVSAARSQPYYLDVTHPEANKGHVVERMTDMLKITAEQIATIGDMPSDVLMFKKSGMSIAMGNASDDVKQQATNVTAGYDDEGFAKAVEQFILPKVQ